MKPCVSVIIPSYNRGYILSKTIPTYLEECVSELILIDDCSTDNTPEVVAELKKKYPQIKYYRNEQNLRQTGAKNRALEYVTQPYVYYGDDDSILLPGTISFLLEVMREYWADVVGALPIYAKNNNDMDNLEALINREGVYVERLEDKFDISHLEKTGFFFTMSSPQVVPFVHACALVKSDWLGKAKFDTRFGGNCYREETDYWLQMSRQGAKIVFAASPKAVQINLPFESINRNRTLKSMWRHGKYDIINTLKLIDKHYDYFKQQCGYGGSKFNMKIRYVLNDCFQYAKILPSRLVGMIIK